MERSLGKLALSTDTELTDEQQRMAEIIRECHAAQHRAEVRLGGPGWAIRGCTVCWPCKQRITPDAQEKEGYAWPGQFSRW